MSTSYPADDYTDELIGGHPTPRPVDVVVTEAVRVIEQPATDWTTTQLPVSDTASQVAGFNVARRELLVQNIGAAPVFIAPSLAGCSASLGYQLAAGASVKLVARTEVYAVCAAGQASTVALLGQNRDG